MANAGAPASASEIAAQLAGSSLKPLVRLVAGATQSIPDNTATALQFSTEDVDTHGYHDNATNNSRITPTKAGWYRVSGTYYTGGRADYASVTCFLRKNGSTTFAPGGRLMVPPNGTTAVSCSASIPFNGAGDYVELMALQDNTANAAQVTTVSLYFTSTLEAEFVRDL